jgi:hypothetical protein
VKKDGQLGWDRPGVFGAIPSGMMERAKQECARQNSNMKPLGFHPRAIDLNGQPLQDGGFLCVE